MSSPTIMCVVCQDAPEFKTDKEYKEHLLKVHGTTTTQAAMNIERNRKMNTPVNLPPGITEKDLPNKEFLETLKRAEEERLKMETTIKPPLEIPSNPPQAAKSTLELKYKYEGKADCGHEVKTIMLEAEGKLFAVGYDMFCDKMIKRIEVHPIKENKDGNNGNKAKATK